MASYQVTSTGAILRDDGASIPPDPRNADFRAYQAWVAAGNTAPLIPAPPRAPADVNADAIHTGLQTAIQNNIAAAASITAVGTKANGYANNPATDLTTAQITSVLKDICSGIVLTSQAILECERQLTGIERLMLGQLDTTAGS